MHQKKAFRCLNPEGFLFKMKYYLYTEKKKYHFARTRLGDASFCIEGLGIYLQNGNSGSRYPGQMIHLKVPSAGGVFPLII